MNRTHLALAAGLLMITAAVVQSSRVYGLVYDGNRRPLVSAHVWIADAEGVRLRLRTDARGQFHAWHFPFALRDGRMLVCAPGHSTLVTSKIVRAWVAEFGLGAWPSNAPFPPRPDSTWTYGAPSECANRVARASS